MTFPLPFGPGMFVPPDKPKTKPITLLPDLLSFTTATSTIPTGSKPSEADIERMLAELKPAPVKRASSKRSDPDPPGMKYPYVTQFCANGGHENIVALSFRGTRMKSCSGKYFIPPRLDVVCTCHCHVNSTRPAIPMAPSINSGGASVTVDPRPVEMAVTEPEDVGFNPNESPYDRLLNNKVMDLGPRVRNLVLKHLGREVTKEMLNEPYVLRRRGELDSNVEAICRLWLDKAIPGDELTTDWISLLVDVDNPPSKGAIHAVLMRWDESNFAIVEKNPVRFICFTPTVQEIGIEAARKLAHRKSKNREKGFVV